MVCIKAMLSIPCRHAVGKKETGDPSIIILLYFAGEKGEKRKKCCAILHPFLSRKKKVILLFRTEWGEGEKGGGRDISFLEDMISFSEKKGKKIAFFMWILFLKGGISTFYVGEKDELFFNF